MTKDIKELMKYLGLIFISVLLTYKLPRDSYSIMQYIIKPIRFENSVLFISAIVPLALFIVAIKGLFKTEPIGIQNKIAIVIIVLLMVIPLMKGSLDLAKNAYFQAMKVELKSIDIKDSNLSFSDINEHQATLSISLSLTDYGRNDSNFKVRMYLPESLKEYVQADFLEFDESYQTFGNRQILNITKKITVPLEEGTNGEKIMDTHWYWDTFKYELYNESNSSELVYHGI
ncbi:hypothetical protein [Desulfitobacterium metallireducens]|uniref:Uncharacterized protein n=1 Tax=Desulfitobacterium metallireducens DSM 15288 TaxID=871968 RepID=W0EDH0_9FIRM|nr:hypothetical protein [Desulfitobacterium metallireducens]AHF07224.1 hypothetical protein DESME_09370 [Desulfitobacterium metallireducens DSM 15288]